MQSGVFRKDNTLEFLIKSDGNLTQKQLSEKMNWLVQLTKLWEGHGHTCASDNTKPKPSNSNNLFFSFLLLLLFFFFFCVSTSFSQIDFFCKAGPIVTTSSQFTSSQLGQRGNDFFNFQSRKILSKVSDSCPVSNL